MAQYRRAIVAAISALSLFAPGQAAADPSGVGDPANTSSQRATGVFGTGGSGQASPDSKTGALSYAYAFELPAARGIPQPALTLTYNSSTRDREAGYGWGLDLPTIERRPMSGNPRFDGTASDERFHFNGAPLVHICKVSACSSDEKHLSSLSNWDYYRLQVEGLFARFYLSSDKKRWLVQLKNTGEQLEFGPSDGSDEAIEFLDGDSSKVVRWRLRRQVDALHTGGGGQSLNIVQYRWQRLGKRGLLYLTDVFDTPTAAGHVSDSDFAHHTELSWEDPGFLQTFYADAFHAVPDRRLSRVAVASKTWSGSGPRQAVRIYHLRYASPRFDGVYSAPNTAPLWNHSFLREIQMEGACAGSEEDESGHVSGAQRCPEQPKTSFEYEGGEIGHGASSVSKVIGGPADLVSNRRVFVDHESATIIDFNRDGLPDLLQPWDSGPDCFDERGFTSISPGGSRLSCWYKDDPDDPGDPWLSLDIRDARPIIGYLNRGSSGTATVTLQHQCMDAGSDINLLPMPGHSPANLNAGKASAFFTAQGGATIGGAWGLGLAMWVPDSIPNFEPRPFWAVPTGYSGTGCDLQHFDPATFSPSWRWTDTEHGSHWAKAAPSIPGNTAPNWYTDIDGDGLVDEIAESGLAPLGSFRPGRVHFTRRFAANEPGGDTTPVQRPFDARQSSPSLTPVSGSFVKYFYADATGDGLVDLVTLNSAGELHVRPGNGRGDFACLNDKQPWLCDSIGAEFTHAYRVRGTTSATPITFPFDDHVAMHDVTGDGLADIVHYEASTGFVQLWINLDGLTFGCAPTGCNVGRVLDDVHSTFDIGPAKISFADMNADGVDDIVVIAGVGVVVVSTMQRTFIALSPRAPRPGLLTRIDNGRGATTSISYKTIQELDLEASEAKAPWQHHSRAVESVVTRIETEDSAGAAGSPQAGPYRLRRLVRYTYRDPAYDRWTRSFQGFRKVSVQSGDEIAVTETTYWYGACANDLFSRLVTDHATSAPEHDCLATSDDDPDKARNGYPIRVARVRPEVPGQSVRRYLWVENRYLDGQTIYSRADTGADRSVSYVFPERIEIAHYDDALPTPEGPFIDPPFAGKDGVESLPEQAERKVVVSTRHYDLRGTLTVHTESGLGDHDTKSRTILSNEASGITRDLLVSLVPCNDNWECNPSYAYTFGWYANGSTRTEPSITRIVYQWPENSGGAVQIAGWLADALALNRHPASGRGFAPTAPDQVLSGWQLLATMRYDEFGNLKETSRGPGTRSPICTSIDYDEPYRQLPFIVRQHTSGCGSTSIDVTTVFDRGFGIPVVSSAPSSALTTTELDPFGRPIAVYAPTIDGSLGDTTLAATFAYTDEGPAPFVETSSTMAAGVTIRSVLVHNGIGESIIRYDQGIGSEWIVSSAIERDLNGRTARVAKPVGFVGDPVVFTKTCVVPTSPAATVSIYDGAGRLLNLREVDASAIPTDIALYDYRPLTVDSRDAEQIRSGGPHSGAYTHQELDGHGRVRRTIQHTSNGDIVTDREFYPSGQPRRIARASGGTPAYERTFIFDTLGHMSQNSEPNTGNDWRYVWDNAGQLVGTSDARGCGKNIHYDGLGRVVGEDYSPCLLSQPDYSPPDEATGEGFETLYRYDAYEADQLESEPGFNESAGLAKGQLVSVQDRGSYTRFNYDSRSRTRRVSRRIIKPLDFVLKGTSRYTAHWYKKRIDYDLAGRPTRRTTGVDVDELLINDKSEETAHYNSRGFPQSVNSSYGQIVADTQYDVDGAVDYTVFGDAAATSIISERDDRRRLTRRTIKRSHLSQWDSSTSTYPLPGPDTTLEVLADYSFPTNEIDDVGNPKIIEDWTPYDATFPAHAAPVRRREIAYDDFYRVTAIDYTYALASGGSGGAPFVSPYAAEVSAGDRRPIPLREPKGRERIRSQKFDYDVLGNVRSARGDEDLPYDRTLGTVVHGTSGEGPNQLQQADGVSARYDKTGNLVELKIERSGSACPSGPGSSHCAQWLAYDWDEIGQLTRARRWDFVGPSTPALAPDTLPAGAPTWDLAYAYTMGLRTLKSATDEAGIAMHSLEIFDSLRIDRTAYTDLSEDYDRDRDRVRAFWRAESLKYSTIPRLRCPARIRRRRHCTSS